MHDSLRKMEQIKSLEHGKGIPYLLDRAYEILGNPILIHDMEYKTIEYNKNVVTDDPIWNEYITKGTVGADWLNFFKDECFIEAAANVTNITFLTSDKLDYNRVYGKIFNKNNIQIGCAVMTACDRPFEQDTPALFEEVCVALSTEFSKSDFYNDYGQAYFEKLVHELIDGVEDITLYAAHVESIYMHLKSNLYLAVVDIGPCDPAYTQLTYYRDLFKKTQPEYTYALYGNYILIIISTDDWALHVEKDLTLLNQLFCKHSICAGISRSFENLFELDQYYKEALGTLQSGHGASGQCIFLFGH